MNSLPLVASYSMYVSPAAPSMFSFWSAATLTAPVASSVVNCPVLAVEAPIGVLLIVPPVTATAFASWVAMVPRPSEVRTWTGNYYIATAACKDFETRLARNYASYYAPMARRFQEMYHVDERVRATGKRDIDALVCKLRFNLRALEMGIAHLNQMLNHLFNFIDALPGSRTLFWR